MLGGSGQRLNGSVLVNISLQFSQFCMHQTANEPTMILSSSKMSKYMYVYITLCGLDIIFTYVYITLCGLDIIFTYCLTWCECTGHQLVHYTFTLVILKRV